MTKLIEEKEEFLVKIKAGLQKLTRAVKTTMGPKGRHVVIDSVQGAISTKDGMFVAKEMNLKNPFENIAVELFKQCLVKTKEKTGDGTCTALLLAEAIFLEGMQLIQAGQNPVEIQRELSKAVDLVCHALKMRAVKVEEKDIEKVATISANQDQEIGKLVAEAIRKVGHDGSIGVQEGKGFDTTLSIVEGMSFDKGYASAHFVTDTKKMVVNFENCNLFITDMKLNNVRDIANLLNIALDTKKPLLIVADDFSQEVLSMLVLNKMKASMPVCAVKAPSFGDEKKQILIDIATLTGANFISEELGHQLKDCTVKDFGKAKNVRIEKDLTSILNGEGDKEQVEKRKQELRILLNNTKNDHEANKLQNRLAKMSSGIATIFAGAATETQMKEKMDRIENALNATRLALIGGVLSGGGVAYIRAIDTLDSLNEKLGARILKKALMAPAIALAQNAGKNGEFIAEKISEANENIGFDLQEEIFTDLFEKGIIDPVYVLTEALVNAASTAGTCLTADSALALKPKAAPSAMPNPMGMGGMGGMGPMM